MIGADNTMFIDLLSKTRKTGLEWVVVRDRCFLGLEFRVRRASDDELRGGASLAGDVRQRLRELIHLPGLRGNPERTYPVTAVGDSFPGTFEHYVASLVAHWEAKSDRQALDDASKHLQQLGLTWKVTATPINDTQVELRVGRMVQAARGGTWDLVNVADVGFGVSQALPVVVALVVARPGQLVYLEQPELHLHPRAQTAMAEVLAAAARRGVRVVAETHSHLLLLGIQTLVAEGKLAPELVKLHWFRRDDDGATRVNSAELDESGAFGDWPEDFAEVSLQAESRYLDAVEARHQRS
jgi:hypothetical protein